jgi:hypothetical protein
MVHGEADGFQKKNKNEDAEAPLAFCSEIKKDQITYVSVILEEKPNVYSIFYMFTVLIFEFVVRIRKFNGKRAREEMFPFIYVESCF